MKAIRFSLGQDDIPSQWYNLLADFPEPVPPPLHPGTKQPVTLADDGRDYDAVAAAREGALSDAA